MRGIINYVTIIALINNADLLFNPLHPTYTVCSRTNSINSIRSRAMI